jgi:hypothetical protein
LDGLGFRRNITRKLMKKSLGEKISLGDLSWGKDLSEQAKKKKVKIFVSHRNVHQRVTIEEDFYS